MKPDHEKLLGQLIDFWYRQNIANIDLQRAVEDFLNERATDETLLFSTFYHEDAMCDAHSRHVEVKIDWDGITIVFLIDFIHRDFTAQVRYRPGGWRSTVRKSSIFKAIITLLKAGSTLSARQ